MSAEPRTLPREMVLASAGSGKTYHLSSALIGLLALGVAPEAIWASTFTRKAAGEILEQLLLRLARGALGEEEATALSKAAWLGRAASRPETFLSREHCGRLLSELAQSLHRANISTLDSFFVQVATTFAQELGLPPGWRLVEGPAEDRMRSEALEAVLDQGDSGGLSELVRMIARGEVRRGVHGELLEHVEQLLELDREVGPAGRAAWVPVFSGVDASEPRSETAIRSRSAELAEALTASEPPANKNGKPNSNWEKELPRLAQAVREGDWKGFFEKGLGKKLVETGESVPPGEVAFYGLSPDADLARLLTRAVGLARTALARDLIRQAKALGELAARYRTAFEAAQKARGGYRFGDITHVLREASALGMADALYFRLDARIQHLLLDEFQDTSLPQWEVLKPFVSELLAGGEGERAAVIVADPKQSIYGWRGARPSLVPHVREEYSLEPEKLSKSFRSGPVILETVKEVFSELESAPVIQEMRGGPAVAEEWLGDFYPQEASDARRPGYAELRVGPPAEGRRGVQPALLDHAADFIGEITTREPRASIGVLVRTNKVVSYLIAALRKRGIPASGEGGTPLTDAAPVNAILALLRLADHPGDRLAQYHVALTPLGKVVAFTDYQDDAQANRMALEVRGRLMREGFGVTLDEWAKALRSSCNPMEQARLLQLVELGFRWDRERTIRPGDFVRFVEGQGVEDPSGARVRVMSVHQSKGLQFDVVVLPHLYQSLEGWGNRDPVTPFRDPATGQVVQLYPAATQAARALLPELRDADDQARASRLRDELSALYVAMTRARYALHMVVPADGEKGPSTAKSAARILRDALAPGEPADVVGKVLYPPDGDRKQGDPCWFEKLKGDDFSGAAPLDAGGPAWLEATDPVPLKAVSGPRVRNLARRTPSSMEGGELLDLGAHLRLDLKGDARLRGTVVHAWCERLEWMEEGLPDDTALLAVALEEAPGLAEERVQEWISDFKLWMKGEAVLKVLSRTSYPSGARVERELPFLQRVPEGILQGLIDRLVLWEEGGRVVGAEVLDFKTDYVDGSEADALAVKVDFYRPQIDAYRRAVAGRYRLEPSQVSGKLLFLMPGVVREV